MVHYIRFLKPPKIQITSACNATAKSLITITNDLGDEFYYGDLTLDADLLPSGMETMKPFMQRKITWTAGMRTLWVVFERIPLDVHWRVRLHIGASNFQIEGSLPKAFPDVLNGWSESFGVGLNLEAGRRVERRLTLSSDNMLSIFEDPGESIARHIWDAGIALLDYMRNLQEHTNRGLLPPLNNISRPSRPEHRKVLELGSGCGIVGIGFAQLYHNCDVLLTDLPEAMEILDFNITRARPAFWSKLSKVTLNWDDDLPMAVAKAEYHLFLVSDCTYNSDSIPALVRTLHALSGKSPKASILVSMKVRHTSESIFFDLMDDAGFRIAEEARLPMPDRHRSAVGQELEAAQIYIFHTAQSLDKVSSDR